LSYFLPLRVGVQDNPDGKTMGLISRKWRKLRIKISRAQPVHAATDRVDGKTDQENIAKDPSIQPAGEHRFIRLVPGKFQSQTMALPPPEHSGHRRMPHISTVYIYRSDPGFTGDEHLLPGAVHDGGAAGEESDGYSDETKI